MSGTSRSIRKIKINEKKVEVHYTLHHYTDDERVLNSDVPLKSQVRPHIDFFNAFQAIKKHAISLMELSLFKGKVDEKTLDKHTVTTVNLFEGDDDTIVMISMNKHLASGKVYSVTSPRISLNNEDYDKIGDLAKMISKLEDEAHAYVKGEKNGEEQLELKFEAA